MPTKLTFDVEIEAICENICIRQTTLYNNNNKSRPQSQTQPSKQTKISIHIE